LCPYGDDTIVCAYYAPAEVSVFLELGYPPPKMVVDLYAEFACKVNGLTTGKSLLDAMRFHGLEAMDVEHKNLWRDRLINSEPPFPVEWIEGALEYNWVDVDMTARLLEKMAPGIDWPRALLRGSYMRCLSEIERRGVPIDLDLYQWVQAHWEEIKLRMIESCGFDVFEGTRFSQKKFAQCLRDLHITSWELTETGYLVTQGKYFQRMMFEYPELAPILSVKRTLDTFNRFELAVGPDGRNRAPWWPFSSKTGRNQPKAKNIFSNHSRWVKGIGKPPPGRAIIELDYCQQEFGIAAALSQDAAMMQAYMSGDPYLALAIMAGDAPRGATKQSHPEIRQKYKVVALATQFGSTFLGIARQLQVQPCEAALLLSNYNRVFKTFRAWQVCKRDNADWTGEMILPYGWRMWKGDGVRWRTVDNFWMQGTGSEMLRAAVVRLHDVGLPVIGLNHDAIIFETDLSEAETAAARAGEIMGDVSEAVLAGRLRLTTETTIIAPDERMLCKEARPMWEVVTGPYFAERGA
jgi:DNA polymerase I-like protein with 3'-5' exonuclease and polymerase domains